MRKSRAFAALMILALVVSSIGVGSLFAQDGPGDLQAAPSRITATASVDPAESKVIEIHPSARFQGATGEAMVSVIVKLDVDPAAGKAAPLNAQVYRAYVDGYLSVFEANAALAIPGAKVVNRYDVVFGGVSMIVPESQVEALAGLPGVVSVVSDQLLQLDTERSPRFIGANRLWKELGGQGSAGEGVIVGDLDTGIWPEHPSFSDPDPSGKPYDSPPVVPGSNGFGSGGARSTCDFGDTAWNPNDAPFTCNNKLIGAYDFLDTYRAVIGLLPGEFDSARDSEGHGTHTASTAAGNGGVDANIFGVPRGTVSGIAPRAHVIMYRVCADQGCYGSDSIRAVQQAVLDEADVVNFSISGGGSPYSDSVSLAFLDAYAEGTLVSASAGNSGPGANTVGHREPWTITVGASTTDRFFISTVTLSGLPLTDAQVSVVHGIPGLVVDVYVDGALLLPSFAPGDVAGPLSLPAGTYDLAISPEGAGIGAAVLTGSATVADGDNVSIVAHLTEAGAPTISIFNNDASLIAAGNSRVIVRHTAAAPAVDIFANGGVLFGNVSNPQQGVANVPAGTYSVAISPAGAGIGAAVFGPADVELPEGTARIVYAIGDLAGGTFGLVVQDIADLTIANYETLELSGASVTDGISTPTRVIFPPAGSELCLTPFAPGTFSGEIVICRRGVIARVAKSFNVAAGGAGGMLQYNPTLQGLATDNHVIPSVHLENDAGDALLDFMATHASEGAVFTQGTATAVQGDVMAAFSSRGGPAQVLGISKPDVTAPGVQILAGHTPLPHSVDGGLPGELFQAIQGTSMAAPHVTGAVALLKDLHPDWTPGQLKSALMTTAKNYRVYKEDGVTPADPFDMGSGRINLRLAWDPGFTISDTAQNFEDLEDELWNANYPSVYVPNMPGQITVYRTVHSELDFDHHYSLHIKAPKDLKITLEPADHFLDVPAGGDATFSITIDARNVPQGEVRHAWIILRDSHADSHIPVTIVRGEANVLLDKECDPSDFSKKDGHTSCTITIENTSVDDAEVNLVDEIPWGLDLVRDSVVGADWIGHEVNPSGQDRLEWSGTLAGAAAPVIGVIQDPSPFGYFSLGAFGVTPFGLPSNSDDGGWILSGLPSFSYNGQSYTSVIWSVNGTVEAGTASGLASAGGNRSMPNASLPNNLLAPWWTDLDLTNAGNWYVAVLTAGPDQFIVFEWEDVPRFGGLSSTFTFQVWIEAGTDNIWYVYDGFAGDTADGTVGAENANGTIGDTYYFEGAGTNPWGGPDLRVTAAAGAPGESHTVTFDMTGWKTGRWQNCAEMTGDIFQGTAISCTGGRVTR